jgi:quercetin dioxygenase-like cupin family protein
MRNTIRTTILSLLAVAVTAASAAASEHPQTTADEQGSAPKLENLLATQLEGFKGAEVIVSRVTIPPHTALPKHWHPGEEFGYVLEGSVILWQEGKEDVLCHAGEAVKIPLEQVHTAITQDEGATVLVFRVHQSGKPERVPVD